VATEKNNLPSQHNLNNYHAFSTEERRKNRFSHLKSENSIMQTGINCISPKFQNKNYNSFNQNDNKKYKENYINSVEKLKENFDSPSIRNRNMKMGMRYDDIPRIPNDKKFDNLNGNGRNENGRMNMFCNGIEKSIKYYKMESDTRNMNELIDEENFKLKNYMCNMNKFLELGANNNEKYPHLNDIQKMKKLRYQNLILSNNRYMGEKYDPLNYA
jgi:hypothetical protein